MLQAVIVDDEIPGMNLLKMFLEKTGQVNVLETFTEPIDALENIYYIKPDVVFLDIEMPEMSGLELASRLLEQDDELMVVFVTGYNQYALEAFQVNALDYILKPVTSNTVHKCISRLNKLKESSNAKKTSGIGKKIRCFGDFEVLGDRGSVKWATRKVEEMLAYFIIHRDSNIEAWQLGEALWPEEDSEKVKSNVHTTLYRLRKTIKEEGLGIEISSEKGGKGIYRSSLGQLSCDLIVFEGTATNNNSINSNNVDEFESACFLYRDDLFLGKSYGWCERKKEWLYRCHLNMLNKSALFYVNEGLLQNAMDKLIEAAGIAPFDEVIHRNLLKVYGAQMNRSMLIKCHEEFKQSLFEEMGVVPQDETQEFFNTLVIH